MNAPTALIADDEPHLRAALRHRLAQVWPELVIVAEARNGLEALDLAAEHEPDIAFLDIRMPGLDGMELARRLAGRCHLVFVTAFDEYAVQAFEREAVDYLLKPVTAERLAATRSRLCERLARQAAPEPLVGLLERLRGELGASAPPPLRWIRAGVGDAVQVVAVEQVHCFIAADKYVSVFTAGQELLIRKSMRELEAELDPQQFWRVHRGAIINVAHLERCWRDEEGRLRLRVHALDRELLVSRSQAHLFRQM